ncbi:hypothetical protein HAD_01505 [Hyphomonas adhaerens MHS-3]|uniref:Uncharacterized protein n=1 Tax=Hyphomonas adhaerens MHS-3 TaxID=1280949 RepID=A0A069E3D4_9PROT|nr:hypothetical protein HAD_01505 [Hyphomonas adhaerens MHS-3]
MRMKPLLALRGAGEALALWTRAPLSRERVYVRFHVRRKRRRGAEQTVHSDKYTPVPEEADKLAAGSMVATGCGLKMQG